MFYKWLGNIGRPTNILPDHDWRGRDECLSKSQHVDFDTFTAEINGGLGTTYIGVGASINRIHAEASFERRMGLERLSYE